MSEQDSGIPEPSCLPLSGEEIEAWRRSPRERLETRVLATIDAQRDEIATMRGIREALDKASGEVVALQRKLVAVWQQAETHRDVCLSDFVYTPSMNDAGRDILAILKGEGE